MKRLLKRIGSFENIMALRGCQSVGYCEVVLNDKKVILGGSIATLSKEFGDEFIRISRTVLVNKKFIVDYSAKSVTLTNQMELGISRRKSKDVLKALS